MYSIARFFIVVGIVFVIIGSISLVFPKLHFFRLPGDIVMKRDNFVFIFPITTGIMFSIILTVLINLIFRK
jgi:hypothetical protein